MKICTQINKHWLSPARQAPCLMQQFSSPSGARWLTAGDALGLLAENTKLMPSHPGLHAQEVCVGTLKL